MLIYRNTWRLKYFSGGSFSLLKLHINQTLSLFLFNEDFYWICHFAVLSTWNLKKKRIFATPVLKLLILLYYTGVATKWVHYYLFNFLFSKKLQLDNKDLKIDQSYFDIVPGEILIISFTLKEGKRTNISFGISQVWNPLHEVTVFR